MRDFQTRRQKSLCDESFANRNDFCHALRNEKREEIASSRLIKKVKLSLANGGKNHGEGGGVAHLHSRRVRRELVAHRVSKSFILCRSLFFFRNNKAMEWMDGWNGWMLP